MNTAQVLMILRTIAAIIRDGKGDELTDDDANDLGSIAEWLAGGRVGL